MELGDIYRKSLMYVYCTECVKDWVGSKTILVLEHIKEEYLETRYLN